MTYKYHYIYKITNIINNKYYIGLHSCNTLNDGYLGSGKLIKAAIQKYGKDKFSKQILYFLPSRKELLQKEKEVVTEKIVKDPMSYNISLGGRTYIDSLKDLSNKEEFIKHQSNAGKKGGKAFLANLSLKDKAKWHKKGNQASLVSRRKNPIKLKIKNKEEYNKNRSKGAFKRERFICDLCGKENLDKGNLKLHRDSNSCKKNQLKNDLLK